MIEDCLTDCCQDARCCVDTCDTTCRNKLLALYSDNHVVPLPDGHRFPMDKYRRTRENVASCPALRSKLDLLPAPAVSMEDLLAVHDAAYIQRFRSGALTPPEMRNIGFPWSTELVRVWPWPCT